MASITTREGDTFDLLARRAYGDGAKAALLRSANAGVLEPFDAGLVLTVPQVPRTLRAVQTDNPLDVGVLINGRQFSKWTSATIERSMDAMSTLSVSAPFDADDAQFRASFIPLSFAPVAVTVGGSALFTGTMLTPSPSVDSAENTVNAACYAVPAVSGDCTAPAGAYPSEWEGVRIGVIARALMSPFGVDVVIRGDEGAAFERVSLPAGGRVLPFIIKLAQQRGLLVSDTPDGAMLITRPVATGAPVARLVEGSAPLLSVAPAFNPQEYYSEITGVEPTVVGLRGGQVTVRNPHLRSIVRPLSYQVDDTTNADIQAACNAKAGRMFANVVSYQITVATWRAPSGALWAPNTTIELTAPGAFVYSPYEFLIRRVVLRTDEETAELELTLPGAFSSTIPERLPWE